MNEKHYFVDEVNVIIDGVSPNVFTITGVGSYDPNMVKKAAIDRAKKESFPAAKYAAVILTHEQVTLEEYQSRFGQNPPWLGNVEIK